jgi:hypothetical protein
MEDEEDDFYDPADTVASAHAPNNAQDTAPGQQMDDMDDEEEVEVDSDEVRYQLLYALVLSLTKLRMISILLQRPPPTRPLQSCKP